MIPYSVTSRLYRPADVAGRRFRLFPVVAVWTILASAMPAAAVDYNWITASGQWNNSAHWSPAAVPGAADRVFIGNTVPAENATVFLSQNVTVADLTMTDGMAIQNQQRQFRVLGNALLSGKNLVGQDPVIQHSSALRITPFSMNQASFQTNTLQLLEGGRLQVQDGAIVQIDNQIVVDPDSSVYLEGAMWLSGNGVPVAYRNDGVLQAGIGGAQIAQLGAGRIDLDGALGNGKVFVSTHETNGPGAATLEVSGDGLADAFDGEMVIGTRNQVTMNLSEGWELGTGGLLTIFGTQEDPARLLGDHVTINGTIEAHGDYGVIQADSTINPSAHIHVNQNDRLVISVDKEINGGHFDVEEGGSLTIQGTTAIRGGVFTTQAADPTGGAVRLSGDVEFDGDVTFNGYARMYGDAHVISDSTITADTFVMGEEIVEKTWTLDADLVVNADRIGTTPVNAVTHDIVINSSILSFNSLEVNVPDTGVPHESDWVLSGDLFVNGPHGGLLGVSVKGSPVDFSGDVTVDGHTAFEAQADFYFGGTTTLVGDSSLRLNGGDLVSTNRISGAQFTGGRLESTNGHALVGYGTIDSDIAFSGNSELRADLSTLNLNGTINDVGVIGTASESGKLNVTQPWNTSVAQRVELRGGELNGANINNDGLGGIRGRGTVNARVNNQTSIAAEGGTLVLNSTLNDYDGSNESGRMDAVAGNLHIKTPANFGYDGAVLIANGHELFVDGGGLSFQPSSILRMDGGAIRGTDEQEFRGTLIASTAANNLIADGDFFSGATSTLNTNFALHQNTRVRADATFTGDGHLVNLTNGFLTLDDEAIVGVDLDNIGTLALGQDIAQASVEGDVFSAGRILFDLGGNTFDLYDRLLVSDTVDLRGDVIVSLLGYDPVGGDVFDVLDFTTFIDSGYVLNLPGLSPGLAWDVSGFETVGELRIVPEPGTLLLLILGAGIGLRRRKA